MATNPYVNKVEMANGTTLMDITDTTATESDVIQGKVLYKGNGMRTVGTLGTATTATDGLMSAADKEKLDGIETGAETNDLFIAVRGVTTYAEIDAAYAAGKTIVLRNSNQLGLYPLYNKTASKYTFEVKTANMSQNVNIDSSNAWTISGSWIIAPKSSALSLTLASGSWSSATPPTQTLTATGVYSDSNVVVGIDGAATAEQYEAAANAQLLCTAQGTNSITVTCFGTKPEVNIPITVLILG